MIAEPPRLVFGVPIGGVGQPTPPPRPNGCTACASLSRLFQESVAREKDQRARVDRLTEQVIDLNTALRMQSPTTADFVALRARLHVLAEQEAAARQTVIENEAILPERALSAERTAENLRIRMRASGITP